MFKILLLSTILATIAALPHGYYNGGYYPQHPHGYSHGHLNYPHHHHGLSKHQHGDSYNHHEHQSLNHQHGSCHLQGQAHCHHQNHEQCHLGSETGHNTPDVEKTIFTPKPTVIDVNNEEGCVEQLDSSSDNPLGIDLRTSRRRICGIKEININNKPADDIATNNDGSGINLRFKTKNESENGITV